MVGVSFRAGGAEPFLSVPCVALRDCAAGLDELRAGDDGDLVERIGERRSPGAMLDTLEEALLRQASPANADHRMISWAVDSLHRGRSIGEVVHRTGASRSRFVRTFAAHVGTTPRQFASLARFQRAVRSLAAGTRDLAGIALECGYFDQSHLGHEFRRFAGRPPGAYRPRDPAEPNHLLE
jgi:AraC-like DNA-binding protein